MADVQTFIPEVINAHFDEAAYLYSEYQVERQSENTDTGYLKDVVSRLNANLEGLMINAKAADEYCEAAAEGDDAGEFFVASYLAFYAGDLEKIKPLAEVAQSSSAFLEAFSSGLAWHPWEVCGFWATKFVSAKQSAMAAIGVFSFDTHNKPLPIVFNDLLLRTLSEENPSELTLLLGIAQKNNDASILPQLQTKKPNTELNGADFEVLVTRLKLGDKHALPPLKLFVLSENENREAALQIAFSHLPIEEAKQWMAELKTSPNSERFLILSVGVMNEKTLIPWVIKQMEVPQLARIAGKVFSDLTGQDLRKNKWILTGEALDEKWLAIDGDEELDWPDSSKIKQAMQSLLA